MYSGKFRHIRRIHNIRRQLLSTGVISVDSMRSKDTILDSQAKELNRDLDEN